MAHVLFGKPVPTFPGHALHPDRGVLEPRALRLADVVARRLLGPVGIVVLDRLDDLPMLLVRLQTTARHPKGRAVQERERIVQDASVCSRY